MIEWEDFLVSNESADFWKRDYQKNNQSPIFDNIDERFLIEQSEKDYQSLVDGFKRYVHDNYPRDIIRQAISSIRYLTRQDWPHVRDMEKEAGHPLIRERAWWLSINQSLLSQLETFYS